MDIKKMDARKKEKLFGKLIGITDFERLMIIFNAIIIMSAFLPFLFIQNLTFTFQYLKSSDVPFYNPSIWGNFIFERFSLEFWVVMSDFVYLIVPFFQTFVLLNSNFNPFSDWHALNLFFLAIATGTKIITAVWRVYQFFFCYGFNFCRCYSPGCCTSYTSCSANFDFQFILGYNLAYLIILIIYGTFAYIRLYHWNLKNQEDTYKEIFEEVVESGTPNEILDTAPAEKKNPKTALILQSKPFLGLFKSFLNSKKTD